MRSTLATLLGIGLASITWSSSTVAQSGIVDSAVKAPIAPDGDVAGAVTDFVINLSIDMDPATPGRTLKTGESIRVTLPAEFELRDAGTYPVRDLFAAPDCKPGLLKCSTGVMLQGWPQHPILPSAPPGKDAQYSFSLNEATNAITYRAEKDLAGVPLPGPGIKQMHLMLFGFRNPERPGVYPIRVSILDASGAETESGVANLHVRAAIAPSINITSVFVPGDVNGGGPPNPNTIYQTAAVGAAAPMPWDFLVWDANGMPFEGIEVVQDDATGGRLVRAGAEVGRFTLSAPAGATGQAVVGGPSSKIPATPVVGTSFGDPIPAGRLTTQFIAGSTPGRYYTTFTLSGGNSVTMVVDATGG